ARGLRLGHREAAADLALEQRLEPLPALLRRAMVDEDLDVARVGRRAVEDHRRDEAAPHRLAEHPVLPVAQAGAVLAGEEEVPEALGLSALTQLHEDSRIRDSRLHLLIERLERLELDRIHVLVEEGVDATAQLL